MSLLGYARVSTDRQDATRQHLELTAAGCERVWEDIGSGKTMTRPQLDALLAYARTGDVLVVTELSRVGRSMRGVVELVDDLAQRGIGIRSLAQGIDTSAGPMAKVVLAVVSALAEVERDILIERTRSGLSAARAAGRVGGRPTVVTPERLTAARTMLASGQTVAAVARTLGVGRASLYRALERAERNREAVPVG